LIKIYNLTFSRFFPENIATKTTFFSVFLPYKMLKYKNCYTVIRCI